MTVDSIELDYYLSAKDRLWVYDCLVDLSRKGQGATAYFMTHPYFMPVVYVFLSYNCIDWLVRIWPVILAGDWAEILGPSQILGSLFGFAITWYLLDSLWQFLSRYWGQGRATRAGREGVNWGRHQLTATPEALTIQLAAHRKVYNWTAFSGFEKTKYMLLLMLTPGSAVAVPRAAFKSELDEGNFCELVQSQITGV